jgi:hypothetical protein
MYNYVYRGASDRKYIETALFMDSAAYRFKSIFNFFTSEKFIEKLKKVVTHIAKQTENIFLGQLSFFFCQGLLFLLPDLFNCGS